MSFNELAKQHHAWIVSVGWNHSTVLEQLAMIASELGEVAECLIIPSKWLNRGEEIADVVLRMLHLGCACGVDIDAGIGSMDVCVQQPPLVVDFADLMVKFGRVVNASRKGLLGTDFHEGFGELFTSVLMLAKRLQVQVEVEVSRKMALNQQRGTRGRII